MQATHVTQTERQTKFQARRPELSLKMQGKQPAHVAQPKAQRPVLPRGESKMAIDFYIASMLESQVRQLMTEPDGMLHLNRVPTPYRKMLVPSPDPMGRPDVPYFEAEVDGEEEASVTWLEAAFDAIEWAASYLYALLPSFRRTVAKKESPRLPQFTNDIERGHTPMFVEQDPDTPGSQRTPIPGAQDHDQPSYFAIA